MTDETIRDIVGNQHVTKLAALISNVQYAAGNGRKISSRLLAAIDELNEYVTHTNDDTNDAKSIVIGDEYFCVILNNECDSTLSFFKAIVTETNNDKATFSIAIHGYLSGEKSFSLMNVSMITLRSMMQVGNNVVIFQLVKQNIVTDKLMQLVKLAKELQGFSINRRLALKSLSNNQCKYDEVLLKIEQHKVD